MAGQESARGEDPRSCPARTTRGRGKRNEGKRSPLPMTLSLPHHRPVSRVLPPTPPTTRTVHRRESARRTHSRACTGERRKSRSCASARAVAVGCVVLACVEEGQGRWWPGEREGKKKGWYCWWVKEEGGVETERKRGE